MRKMIAAVSVGLLLVAGQAVAAGSNGAVARVSDRVAVEMGATSSWNYDDEGGYWPPFVPMIIGIGAIAAFVSLSGDDASDSD